MSQKKKKKKSSNNSSINMDDILSELEEIRNSIGLQAENESSDDDDTTVDGIDEKIRRILKEELKNRGFQHRAAANEETATRNHNNESEKPKTVEEKLDYLIKLLKVMLREQKNTNNRTFNAKRMSWDDETDDMKAEAFDEFGNPLDVEILDDDDDYIGEKTRPFTRRTLPWERDTSDLFNSIFGNRGSSRW